MAIGHGRLRDHRKKEKYYPHVIPEDAGRGIGTICHSTDIPFQAGEAMILQGRDQTSRLPIMVD
jgi:hypothetical protein